MSIDAASVGAFEIKYETESSIPAPYAYFYHLKAAFDADTRLRVEYQLHYLDRESLSEEEITGEGFTMDDNFSWKGSLPGIWNEVVRQLFAGTALRPGSGSEHEAFFEMVVEDIRRGKQEGEPVNRTEWEYTAQEMVQAIYEIAQREMPLQLQYKRVDADGTYKKLSLTLHFSTRQVDIQQESAAGKTTFTVEWHQLKGLLRTVYMPDYHPAQAQTKEPGQPGSFIDIGDGFWYQFSVSAKNPGKKRDVLAELEKIFEELSR
jgi:hypothetical protein